MKKKLLTLGLLFSMIPAMAGNLSDQMKASVQEIFQMIEADRAFYESSPNALSALIKRSVIGKSFDWERMSKLALARHWRQMNAAQQQRFTEAFQALLLVSYSDIFLKYKLDDLRFKEERPGKRKGTFWLSTTAKKGDKETEVEYYVFIKNDIPKIVDVRFANISLIINYRKIFAERLKEETIEEIISSLEQRVDKILTERSEVE